MIISYLVIPGSTHYVREVVTAGSDFAVVNEYDVTAFAHRMKVWNAEKYEPLRQMINPIGFDNLKIKVSNIRHQGALHPSRWQ